MFVTLNSLSSCEITGGLNLPRSLKRYIGGNKTKYVLIIWNFFCKVFFWSYIHDFRLKGFVSNLHNLGLNVFPLNVGGVRVVGLGVRPHRPGGRGGGGDDSIPLVWELEVVVLWSRLVGMGGVRGVGWVGDRVLLGVVGRGQGSTPAQGTTPAGWVGWVVRLVPRSLDTMQR